MQYRKKPIVVESYKTDKEIVIHTLEGDMKASIGDYIITGVNGEKYPCKPDIFEKTYEVVNNTNYDRQKTENENLKVENQSLRSAANSLKMHYEEAQAEIERLKDILICFMGALSKVRNIDDIESISVIPLMTELNKGIRAEIKTDAYKECIEKVRKLAVGMQPCSDELRVFDNDLDNLLKELMGENND